MIHLANYNRLWQTGTILFSFALLVIPMSAQAATALGDLQDIPKDYTGEDYPAQPLCWVNYSFAGYGDGVWGPLCVRIGRSYFDAVMGVLWGTYHHYSGYIYRADLIWGNPQTDTFAVGFLSANLGGGEGQTRYITRTFTPAGYYQYNASTGAGKYVWNLGKLDPAPVERKAGNDVEVDGGQKITLEWSCLPSRQVNWQAKSGQGTFSQGGWGGGILYKYTFASSASGSGPGTDFDFTGGALKGFKKIKAPIAAGEHDYVLTCKGAISTPVTIPVIVKSLCPTDIEAAPGNTNGFWLKPGTAAAPTTRHLSKTFSTITYDFCIKNTGANGYFIPAKTAAELKSFVDRLPSGVTKF